MTLFSNLELLYYQNMSTSTSTSTVHIRVNERNYDRPSNMERSNFLTTRGWALTTDFLEK
jgi:hypothetical protein